MSTKKQYQELVHIATKQQDRYKRGKRHQDERGEQTISKLVCKTQMFPEAPLKCLKYYVVPSLVKETNDKIILHGGCNNINDKNSTLEDCK